MRIEFELTMEEVQTLDKAGTVSVIMGDRRDVVQLRVDQVWLDFSEKYNFDPRTVQPVPGKGIKFFSAILKGIVQ